MNKNAIKKFAIEAREKLISSVIDKAGMLGITETEIFAVMPSAAVILIFAPSRYGM